MHVKLWPARYCLWCLSFNRLVDIMNELDPPSATGERSPALSELRGTLEPLGQSARRVPAAAKCRPQRRRKSRKLLFCREFNEVGPVTAGRDQKSGGCQHRHGCPEGTRVSGVRGCSQSRVALGGTWLALLLPCLALAVLGRAFSSTTCSRHRRRPHRGPTGSRVP